MSLPTTTLPGTEYQDLTAASGLSSEATVSSVVLTKTGTTYCLGITMSDDTVCYFIEKNGQYQLNTTAGNNQWGDTGAVYVTPQAA